MNKKQIRLTESDLKKIVKESVKRIINESTLDDIEMDAVGYIEAALANELSGHNSLPYIKKIFGAVARLMSEGYEGSLEKLFEDASANLSSQINRLSKQLLRRVGGSGTGYDRHVEYDPNTNTEWYV